MGSDVLLQPSTLQADNHKKRTGFGPQQASFGVYVSNAFGGMSGALRLGVDISVCARNRLQEGGTAESCVRDNTRLLHGRHTASRVVSSVSLSFPPLLHHSHRFSTDDCRKSMQFP